MYLAVHYCTTCWHNCSVSDFRLENNPLKKSGKQRNENEDVNKSFGSDNEIRLNAVSREPVKTRRDPVQDLIVKQFFTSGKKFTLVWLIYNDLNGHM